MIIRPFVNKATNKPYTNVELIKMFYKELRNLQEGTTTKTETERQQAEDKFYAICGGSNNANDLMAFMKQIVDTQEASGDDAAQKLFARALLPVDIKNAKKSVK